MESTIPDTSFAGVGVVKTQFILRNSAAMPKFRQMLLA
jgi:hypothetical protein